MKTALTTLMLVSLPLAVPAAQSIGVVQPDQPTPAYRASELATLHCSYLDLTPGMMLSAQIIHATGPVFSLYAQYGHKGVFEPGFKLALHHKDLEICKRMAQQFGVALPVVEMTLIHYRRLMDAGYGDEDISALFREKQRLFQGEKPGG